MPRDLRYTNGMETLGRWWKKVPVAIRKPLVFMVGAAIIAAGVAMLILPGPGWAAIFLGFAVLATEFAFAERVRDWLIGELKLLVGKMQRAWKHWRKKP
jgi:uncharacterized protein (TIGR02611 family)